MSNKVDLDLLERNIRNGNYLTEQLPPAMLVLIGRIRELEQALLLQCDRIDALYETYTKASIDPLNVREILDKGVVLP